ncbi:hypothetical protein SRABI112_03966 [Pseudomonas mediterranea]|nr:hypothetical protein SRABI112_03966 [Pseudomonas mediterranea]
MSIAQRQIVVHLRGGSLHRQLTQGRQVGLGEESIDCRAGLLRHIDLAIAQALQQFTGRQVDQQQFIGFLQNPIRQRFANLHPGDAAHLVIEAFQVLDIDGGVDIDAGGKQLLDVLPALGVATAGGIAVGQFVHQHQAWPGGEQTVEVHFLEHHAPVLGTHQRLLHQAAEQCFGFGSTVCLHHAGDDLHVLPQLGVGRLQHGVGLADTRCRAQKDFEPATASARQIG